MPDKKSSGGKSDEAEKKGGPGMPVIIGLCVVLLGGGYFLGGMMGGSAAAEETAAEGVVEEETEPEVGKVIDMEAVNINLADNHYLRVAVSIGLDSHVELVDSHGKETELFTAPASDLVLNQFLGASIEELATAEGRDHAREELLEHISERYDGAVVAVYFTEFVMQ